MIAMYQESSKPVRVKPWRLFRRVAGVLALSCTAMLITPAVAQPISQSVRLPNQEYSESREDLKVKVLGGHVRINRSWVAGR